VMQCEMCNEKSARGNLCPECRRLWRMTLGYAGHVGDVGVDIK